MPNDSPGEPCWTTGAEPKDSPSENTLTGHAAYNVVADTVTGLNVRKSDNVFQAIFIFVTVLLLAAVGTVLVLFNAAWELPWYAGALLGAFAGLIVGFFASGMYLMIYRAVRHMQGKHE